MLLGDCPEPGLVGEDVGIAEIVGQAVELLLDLLQLVVHAGAGP